MAEALRWNKGRSFFWQCAAAIVVWGCVVALHWQNDGLWYQGDSSRHAANGIFWWDVLTSLPRNPLSFALTYYARYPVINPTAYPPVFYLLEGAAYRVFGVSPFVAKGLVLSFMLIGTLYLIGWLRRWVDEVAGWAGILFSIQPGIIVWSHAVMLNIPSVVVGTATLFHWRCWLERPESRHIYIASVLGVLAVLTYLPAAFLILVMLAWLVMEGQARRLIERRTIIIAGLALIPLGVWAVVAWKWAPAYRSAALVYGGEPLWKLAAWTFYLWQLVRFVTLPVLLAAAVSLVAGLQTRRWRREIWLAAVWFLTCYAWFAAISAKEPRYGLTLVPPIICLAAVGIVGLFHWLGKVWGQRYFGAVVPALLLLVALHTGLAWGVQVPRVSGFRDIVTFVRGVAPSGRVFYDGFYNGVFSFYLRAEDEQFTRGVVIGSKLLYVTRIEARWGLIERVSSADDVVRVLQEECGCRFLVVERQTLREMMSISAMHHLREALTRTTSFRLIRSFQVEANQITDVDVYEQLGAIQDHPSVRLPFPTLGEDVLYESKPIER